jgi:hypothetical protein
MLARFFLMALVAHADSELIVRHHGRKPADFYGVRGCLVAGDSDRGLVHSLSGPGLGRLRAGQVRSGQVCYSAEVWGHENHKAA